MGFVILRRVEFWEPWRVGSEERGLWRRGGGVAGDPLLDGLEIVLFSQGIMATNLRLCLRHTVSSTDVMASLVKVHEQYVLAEC